MQYQAVFFDFDGVILDSVHVKTRTFAAMFRQYGPEVEKAVVDFHLANGGVSRYDKFQHIYDNILQKPLSQKDLQQLGEQFTRMTIQEVLDAEYIPGALDTLKRLNEQNIPSFVVSGTPEEEIMLIVEKKGLSRYFWEIHGSPRKKNEILADILNRYGFAADRTLFVGDARTDYEAAQKCGTAFLGIAPDIHSSPFPGQTWVNTFVQIH